MTHPTRVNTGALSVADAMRRIDDDEMVQMAFAVLLRLGHKQAIKLTDLLHAAAPSRTINFDFGPDPDELLRK